MPKTEIKIEDVSTHPDSRLSDNHVAVILGVSVATVWRWTRDNPVFPKPTKLSPGCSRWRRGQIDDWSAARDAAAEPEWFAAQEARAKAASA